MAPCRTSFVLFTRLIKSTEAALSDIKTQITTGLTQSKLRIVHSHLTAEYEHFKLKLEDYESLENLPTGLTEEIYLESKQSIISLYRNLDSELQELIEKSVDSKVAVVNNPPVLSRSNIILPKLNVPKFSGNFNEFSTFYAKFDSIINTNAELTNLEKFQYLITILDKEPLSIVEHLPLTSHNYPIALNLLQARYHNPKREITFHCDQLLKLPCLDSRSVTSIRKFIDVYNVHISALQTIQNSDVYKVFFATYILSKLDKSLASRFETQMASSKDFPSIDTIFSFLENQALLGENVNTLSAISKPNPRPQAYSSMLVQTSTCPCCNKQPHKLVSCSVFLKKTPKQRFEFAKQSKCCINCLGNHFVNVCRSQHLCRICSKKHNTLLHFNDRINSAAIEPSSISMETNATANIVSCSDKMDSNSVPATSSALVVHSQTSSIVLLPTALVCLQVSVTQYIVARAVIDTASHVSFLSEHCAQKLKCKRNSVAVAIAGIGQMPTSSNGVCMLNVTNLDGSTIVAKHHPFFILDKITTNLPHFPIDKNVKQFLSNIVLADPTFDCPSPIDVLLGADITAIIFKGEPRALGPGLPYRWNTVFGSVVMGTAPAVPQFSTNLANTLVPACALNVSHEDNLLLQLQKFWTVEEPPYATPISDEDQFCEEFYSSTTVRDNLGRYQVRLPFNPNKNGELGDSFELAQKCLLSLEQKFATQPQFKEKYVEFMKDYSQCGHMIPLPTDMEPRNYISHHGIFKQRGDTSKLRVVFNASANTSSGISLNSLLLTGPKLQTLIPEVILRFRQYPFVFACDIKQMYRQISIHRDDQLYQCILWRESTSQPIQVFVLTTVVYGVTSSPFLALRTLKQLVKDEGHNHPQAATLLDQNIFIDDIIAGEFSLQKAIFLKTELTSLLSRACFALRKWSSNCDEILADLPPDHCEIPHIRASTTKSSLSILGLLWNPLKDQFILHFPEYSDSLLRHPTKRKVLSYIAKIYDPCGWMSPVVISFKCFMQRLWLLSLDWDEPLPPDLATQWYAYLHSLRNLREFSIPRKLLLESASYQLHGFCDASEKGYAAAVYLRSEVSNSIFVMLLLAKTRVAPLRTVSLPRLELLGSYLLTQLITNCLKILTPQIAFESIHLWCDSTIVLHWIQSLPYKLKTFVANKVSFIQTHTQPTWWHYVPSKYNAADLPSRGILPFEDFNCLTWLHGPSWLASSASHWPQSISLPTIDTSVLEYKPSCLITASFTTNSPLFDHVSSWPRAILIVSRILRAWLPSRYPSQFETYRKAELALCKYIQKTAFSEEIKNLTLNRPCAKSIQRLCPFLDDSLIRVGGRLKNSSLSFIHKHPILLPKSHHLVTALINYYHLSYAHCGPTLLQSFLTQKFWILSSRQLIRTCIFKCVRCFRAKPAHTLPLMGDLPSPRVTPSPPFFHAGMDFAGPFPIKIISQRKPTTLKFYICIFVCFATKAVHLEVVEDLSAEAFIDCLQRFISRRGCPAHLYSDCGTNFVGANLQLKRLLKSFLSDPQTQTLISLFTTPRNIRFHFLAPASPSQGGLWESVVKRTKYHLRRVLGTYVPTLLQFITLTARIECILNSRPLVPMSSDPNDLSVLTPAHFLIGRTMTSFPEQNLVFTPENRLTHFQSITAMVQRFWRHWSQQYLPLLQSRSKWISHTPNLELNDLVLIDEPNSPPLLWPVGRITKLHPGSDGVVRVARVRTVKGEYSRPVTKLFRLPAT